MALITKSVAIIGKLLYKVTFRLNKMVHPLLVVELDAKRLQKVPSYPLGSDRAPHPGTLHIMDAKRERGKKRDPGLQNDICVEMMMHT